MVTKIDRCLRNTLEFLKLQDNLFQRSITFVALDIPYYNDLVTNKLIATRLSAIAAFKNDRLKERQRQAILAAKKAGLAAHPKICLHNKNLKVPSHL
jgi:DNA invertase Pin-like site-specific DNA recombinase